MTLRHPVFEYAAVRNDKDPCFPGGESYQKEGFPLTHTTRICHSEYSGKEPYYFWKRALQKKRSFSILKVIQYATVSNEEALLPCQRVPQNRGRVSIPQSTQIRHIEQ